MIFVGGDDDDDGHTKHGLNKNNKILCSGLKHNVVLLLMKLFVSGRRKKKKKKSNNQKISKVSSWALTHQQP